jgi:hypothetical protein
MFPNILRFNNLINEGVTFLLGTPKGAYVLKQVLKVKQRTIRFGRNIIGLLK